MIEYPPSAVDAIESNYRTFASRILVDWHNDGQFGHELSSLDNYVVRVAKDQALTSTAPDELQLVEGHASASLVVELAGNFNGYPLVGHFSPYNGRSIFYANGLQLGVEIRWEIGVQDSDGNWSSRRHFTGVVREVTVDRATGVVKLDCLDFVEKMRGVVDLPAYAIPMETLQAGIRRGGLVDSSSIIEIASRSADFYRSHVPWPGYADDRINTVLRVPFHGSLLPEVGIVGGGMKYHRTETYASGSRGAEAYRDGPWGSLALNCVPVGKLSEAGYKRYYMDQSQTVATIWGSGSWGLGVWIYWEGAARPTGLESADLFIVNNGDVDHRIYLNASAGYIESLSFLRGQHPNTYGGSTLRKNLPTTAGWVFIEARFDMTNAASGGRIRGQLRVNEDVTDITTLFTGNTTTGSGPNDKWWVEVRHPVAMTDLSVIYSDVTDWVQYVARYPSNDIYDAADIDWGRNRALYTMRTPDTSAWDLVKEVAAAEYGAVWFDETGRFVFKNYESIQAMHLREPVKKINIDQVEGLDLRMTMDSVRNVWTVNTKEAVAEAAIVYDLYQDGVPLATSGLTSNGDLPQSLDKTIFRPADFRLLSTTAWNHFFVPVPHDVITVDMSRIGTTPTWNAEWEFDTPIHGKKAYSGANQQYDFVEPVYGDRAVDVYGDLPTLQEWYGRDFIKLEIFNNAQRKSSGAKVVAGFWIDAKNQGRFRIGGRKIVEREPEYWEISTDDVAELPGAGQGDYQQSIERYGRRVLELGNNFWLQDKFQTINMLKSVISKFGRPIPVTDAITVPGDPRVQLGDIIEIQDPEGVGGELRLQVLGIKRELSSDSGLTDTYQVEAIRPPGQWQLEHPEYSLLQTSTILS